MRLPCRRSKCCGPPRPHSGQAPFPGSTPTVSLLPKTYQHEGQRPRPGLSWTVLRPIEGPELPVASGRPLPWLRCTPTSPLLRPSPQSGAETPVTFRSKSPSRPCVRGPSPRGLYGGRSWLGRDPRPPCLRLKRKCQSSGGSGGSGVDNTRHPGTPCPARTDGSVLLTSRQPWDREPWGTQQPWKDAQCRHSPTHKHTWAGTAHAHRVAGTRTQTVESVGEHMEEREPVHGPEKPPGLSSEGYM